MMSIRSEEADYSFAKQREFPDQGRNPRGFATKFYTADGNYDLVGLNWPVFFVRDPMMGPDNSELTSIVQLNRNEEVLGPNFYRFFSLAHSPVSAASP